ncbi:predicted protein [Chaetoceros tenuissimus]|uniref:Uncharacterized protein n=1 Tax=Chaetoceros tenuissimus TaxID=426638 RepID=A0AAD3D0E4_9STRA|nr:predicted protein [Chaetoceros tenuissimus]
MVELRVQNSIVSDKCQYLKISYFDANEESIPLNFFIIKVNGRSEATSVDRLLNPCTYMCGMNEINGSIKN